ncbi:MAG: hypothetical protein KAH86_00965, partial [Methanosarcinales archaeon]|nr:hypothetical protein [Methanosarcinales archaeon]
VLDGTGIDWNANFYGNDVYSRSSHPVMKADFMLDNLSSKLVIAAENDASGLQYRRFGMYLNAGSITGQSYNPDAGWEGKTLFTPVIDKWYTIEIHFYDTHSSLYVYSRDDNSRLKPDLPDYEYNLSDWDPRFHFWAYNNQVYIDNAAVSIQNSSDTLPWVGEYLIISNSTYDDLSSVNVTGILVADLNISADTGGPYIPGGDNVTISGTVRDNLSEVPRSANVWAYVTDPYGTVSKYDLVSDVNGNYEVNFTAPSTTGTYSVKVTGRDNVGVVGSTLSSFDVSFGSTLSTTDEYVNQDEVQALTLEIFDDSIIDDLEGSSINWQYRSGTDGIIQGASTLRHKSGSRSLKVDYDLAAGNEYMFLESGMGAVDVSEYNYITFWLYIPQPDAFSGVALVLENDPTGSSSDERVYGQNPVAGWNYYSFNVSTFAMDLSHDHYLTVLIDDDDSVVAAGSLYIDDFKLIKGNAVTNAGVTINITRPDMGTDSYSTPVDVVDHGDGTYTLNYTNTSLSGNYTVDASIINGIYSGTSASSFGVDGLSVSSEIGGPYTVGDELAVSGSVGSLNREMAFDGNVTLNLTYPNGTSVLYYNSSTVASESYTQSGTYGHSGFVYPQRINDGSTSTYAYTSSVSGDYIQVTWPENKTINRVKAYYYNTRWPTAYKIQVLGTDDVTWIDKKEVSGYVASPTSYPTIEDIIPTTVTKGVRIYYQTSNYYTHIYVYEMWAYGHDTYSVDEIPLPISGNYMLNISAEDSYGINGSAQSLNIPVRFLVSTIFDKISYDPEDNVSASIRAFNGTGYESDAQVSSQLIYVTNGSVIDSNVTTTDSNGAANVTFTLPAAYTSYYINSTATNGGTMGYSSNVTSSANLRVWIDPSEALVGHTSWPETVAPSGYRNITIHANFLNAAGHRLLDQNLTATIKNPDGSVLDTVTLTETDHGLYSADYTVTGNLPEGNYPVEINKYPGMATPLHVVTWGCARCHMNAGMTQNHYYAHTTTSAAYGQSDGPVYPSNFSKEYVHEMHPLTDTSPWGTVNCGYHNNVRDANCVKCHPTEVLPSGCPDCHNSANSRSEDILSQDYGADIHAGINHDVASGKTATSSDGGDIEFAIDNDEDTLWIPTGTTDQVIEIDLASTYQVDAIRLAMSNYKATFSAQGYDGSGWISIMPSTTYTNYGSDKIYSITPVNISKVRVTVSAWSREWATSPTYCGGEYVTVDAQTPLVKSINVFEINNLPATAGNNTSHIACQTCHGGDIPNDVQPTIPQCTDCHPAATGSGMQVMPSNSSSISRQLESYEEISGITAYSAPGFPVSSVTLTASGDQKVEQSMSGKLDYSMAMGVGRIYVDHSGLDFTNATSIKFWLYGNPADDNTQFQISIRNSKSGKWHYNTPQYLNWTGWQQVEIPITSLSEVEILYITHADMLRIQLENYNSDSGTIYIDDLHVEKKGTHTQYQEIGCSTCHKATHDIQPSPECNDCHQTQSHGHINASVSEPTCVECHYMENGKLIVRNIESGNDTTLVEIPMEGARITQCSICHDQNEPHNKQWNYICMDCHRDSQHGQVDESYTDYEKASTCLKCHDTPHNLKNELASKGGCNGCHQHRVHGQNSMTTAYNESIHLDCLRCHGDPVSDSESLPANLGHPGKIHLNTSFGLNATQCMFCHENSTFAYELHTDINVNSSDTNLVESIEDESICTSCHNPVPSNKNESIEARDEILGEPHAVQVAGHGDVSCLVCHGHSPSQLTLNFGQDCTGCHINEVVEPVNSTNGTDISPPQVLGHGNTECKECHGHTNSKLTFVGKNATDCMNCHENASTEVDLLKYQDPVANGTVTLGQSGNVWTVTPP